MSKEPKSFDRYLQLDPVVIIHLKDKDYLMEFNNYAVKGIFQDSGHNLLSMGFKPAHYQDPKILGAIMYWGLKTHQPEVTQEEADLIFSYRRSNYIISKIIDALDLSLPEDKTAAVEDGGGEGDKKDPK